MYHAGGYAVWPQSIREYKRRQPVTHYCRMRMEDGPNSRSLEELRSPTEKAELLVALIEFEGNATVLESLYNCNKALLDHHNLDVNLKHLAGYVRSCRSCLQTGLTIYTIIHELDN